MAMISGSIVKLRAENFMTYEKLSFTPVDTLNIINGANGTGKSSVLCAIILGLGGSAGIAGRATTVSQYIKAGCDKAKIEIELLNLDGDNDIVLRVIRSDNSSSWCLNQRTVSQKTIEEFVKKYNIQPDNLCQVLPQEKVESFAKMNDQQRLKSTLKTVGDKKLYDLFLKLKESHTTEQEFEEEVKQLQEALDVEKRTNERLEARVTCVKEKQELVDKLTLLKQRIGWQKFVDALKKFHDIKKLYKKYKNSVSTLSKKLRRRKHNYSLLQRDIKQYEKKILDARNKGREMKSEMQNRLYEICGMSDEIQLLRRDVEAKEKMIQQWKKDINVVERELEHLSQQITDSGEVNEELRDVSSRIDVLYRKMDDVIVKKNEKEGTLRIQMFRAEEIRRQIDSTEDAAKNKLGLLSRKYPDIVEGIRWLDGNKHKFQAEVYRPMLLEINVKDRNNAKYVENLIPNRDLVAFLCESPEDATIMLQELKDRRNLKVNVVTAPQNSRNNFIPSIPIENLRQFGFKEYIIDMIEAPAPIIAYLAHTFNIHNIPVGDVSTFAKADSVPASIRSFFTDKHRFSKIGSMYHNNVMSRCVEIQGSYYLDNSVNRNQVLSLKKEQEKYLSQVNATREFIANIEREQSKYQQEKETLEARKRTLKEKEREQLQVKRAYDRKTADLNYLRTNVGTDVSEAKQKIEQKIQEKLLQILELHRSVGQLLSTYAEVNVLPRVYNAKLSQYSAVRQKKLEKVKEAEAAWKTAVRKLKKIVETGKRRKHVAKELLQMAYQSTNSTKPNRKNFRRFDEFTALSTRPVELLDQIADCEAKIRCIMLEDDGMRVLEEFENRKREIAKLEDNARAKEAEKAVFMEDMSRLKTNILPKIEELIWEINTRFSKHFTDMNCVGEVVLYKGEDDSKYDKYGIHIKVKFRSDTDMQILDNHTQSGGERTLSIAIYLLSLQDMSSVPFRCIDEINQGLDEVNENRIFNLLAGIGTKEGAPQYFLLTPKLPTNLAPNDKMMFFFTYNGSESIARYKCDLQKIKKRILDSASFVAQVST